MHPTIIKTGTSCCPKAIDFAEADTPYDRRVFESGTAAHAVLQACGEQTNRNERPFNYKSYEHIAHAVAENLISEGRSYDGKPEPPINADRVWAGVNLALDYLRVNQLPVGAAYEIGLAVDAKWETCDYEDPSGTVQHIADFVQLTERGDEEATCSTIVSRDYKSQWDAGRWMISPDEQDPMPVQSKVRALLSVAYHGKESAEVLSLEVVNLRTLATFTEEYWLEDENVQRMFADWKREISTTIKALSKTPRVAAPGAGCFTCPYLPACEAGTDYMQAGALSSDPVAAAKGFCAAQGMRDTMKAHMEELTGKETIEIPGATVGHYYKDGRVLVEGAAGIMADDWAADNGEIRGFSRACGLGVGNLEKLAKAFMPAATTAERKEYVAGLTTTARMKKFGILKGGK